MSSTTNNPTIALFGAPNTGKTTLFNMLTGLRQKVGNYSGVTVEKHSGILKGNEGQTFELLDLPGTYSLVARSEDEAIATRVLVGDLKSTSLPDLAIVVIDAGALERSLAFASQVLDFGLPTLCVVTMEDVASRRGLRLSIDDLETAIGTKVVLANPAEGKGKQEIVDALCILAKEPSPKPTSAISGPLAEQATELAQGLAAIEKASGKETQPNPALALRLLVDEGELDSMASARFGSTSLDLIRETRSRFREAHENAGLAEAKARQLWARERAGQAIEVGAPTGDSTSAKIDRVLTHRFFGLVIFLGLMGLVFQSIYEWAGPFMDMIEGLFGWLGDIAVGDMEEGMVRSLISAVIVDGVGGVMVFLPQIVLLFFFIAIMEESGYMSRAAFLMDRLLRPLGLNGRSFIPMLSGFACAIPAIMATRSISDRASRMTTIMIVPLTSCSARLPVYTIMIGAFVPEVSLGMGFGLQGLVLLGMYLLGIVVAIPAALVFRKWIFKGKRMPFMIELPSYRAPKWGRLARTVAERGRLFLVNAGTIIFAMAIIIWAMSYFPQDGEIIAEHEELRSALVISEDQASEQLDELLASVYSEEELAEEEFEPNQADFAGEQALEFESLNEALDSHATINRSESAALMEASILGQIGKVVEPLFKPLGWDWRISTASIASFPAREVVIGVMGTIFSMGDDQDEESEGLRDAMKAAKWPNGEPLFTLATALSLMIFFALCMQCGASVAVVKRETNSWKWAAVSFFYMTALAYICALIAFQITTALL